VRTKKSNRDNNYPKRAEKDLGNYEPDKTVTGKFGSDNEISGEMGALVVM
jgi:hypothetical protein